MKLISIRPRVKIGLAAVEAGITHYVRERQRIKLSIDNTITELSEGDIKVRPRIKLRIIDHDPIVVLKAIRIKPRLRLTIMEDIGSAIEFRVSVGYIQWRYSANSEWQNLIAIGDLPGMGSVGSVIGSGPRSSASDSGLLFEISIDDDYMYVCVKEGSVGNAIWKKSILIRN